MDNFNLDDLNFSDDVIELDESSSSGPLVRWAFAKLATSKGIAFESGAELEIPEITINGAPLRRKGLKPGGIKSFWFALETHTREGEPYTLPEMYTVATSYRVEDKGKVAEHKNNAVEVVGMDGLKQKLPHVKLNEKQVEQFNKDGYCYISDFSNLMKPALAANLGAKANELQKAGLWLRIEYTTFRVRDGGMDDQGKPKKYYDSYWSKVTAYDSKTAWEAAKGSEVVASNGITYPDGWGTAVDAMLDYIAGQIAPDSDFNVKIAEWKLAGASHAKAILKEAVERKDVLPPMKVEIVAAIDAWDEPAF